MNTIQFFDNKDGLYTLRVNDTNNRTIPYILTYMEAKRLKNQLNKIKEL